MIKNMDDLVCTIWLFVVLGFLVIVLQGCSLKGELGLHGITGVSNTQITKDFVEGPKKINARRY